jgi:tetratricopeptide (TPR) repeat protein
VLLLALADLRDLQGRYDDAQALYRRVLEQDPGNALAINNLAVLLALQQKGDEALDLTRRGIEAAGPAPALLDTRALVYLTTGQAGKAVPDLEDAVAQQPTASRYYRLAQAYRSVRDRNAATLAFQRAKSMGLTASVLHPLERADYEKVRAELDGN